LSARSRDEEDLHDRAGRGSRPRSRLRPQHLDAEPARVVTVDRGRYACLMEADGTAVVAMRARELGRRSVVVGDEVAVVGDTTGGAHSLARIVRVEQRRSALRRTADDDDPIERVLVANADLMVIVSASVDPPPQPRLIDRCLVAACDAGVEPLLCVTKVDLSPPDELLRRFAAVDVPVVVTGSKARDDVLGDLLPRLHEGVSVFVGTSGVGKSTLVNALVPDATQRIGSVSMSTGKGMHTTTAAIALPLPGGGWVVDTPGVRSFGLAHVDRDRLVSCFTDLAGGAADCPGDCDHLDPDVCCLDEWVAAGHADPDRLDSLRRLLLSRDTE
jgi:ribosome biogenesis GTPase / thiamine phosphate phosphatase